MTLHHSDCNRISSLALLTLSAVLIGFAASNANAAEKASSASKRKSLEPSAADTGAEQVNVDAIREKYWARGDEAEIGVVQNRLYSKAKKISFSLFGGSLSYDPFLSTRVAGGSLSYYFNEYISAGVLAWKSWASPSQAYDTFRSNVAGGIFAPTNAQYAYYAGEVAASLLYGKLSVVGKKIIYFDLHAHGGGGMMQTASGSVPAAHIGLGQQIFLEKWLAIRADYRAIYFKEDIKDGNIGRSTFGQVIESRTNWTHAITIGVNFLFGGGD